MKYRYKCLIVLLFFASSQHASDILDDQKIENKQESIIAGSAFFIPLIAGFSAWQCKASLFGVMHSVYDLQQLFSMYYLEYHKASEAEALCIAEHYPYAQAWYNDIAQQQPDDSLSQYQLLTSFISTTDAIAGATQDVFKCLPNRIFIPEADIKIIDFLYQKKIKGQDLSTDEDVILGRAQWALLHEAGHLKHKDLTQGTLIFALSAIIVEIAYQMHKDKIETPSSWPVYIALHFAIYTAMTFSQDIIYNIYSRYREARADAFANQYADDNGLLGGKQFFQEQEKRYSSDLMRWRYLFLTHPTHESRAQAIDKEIERRAKFV